MGKRQIRISVKQLLSRQPEFLNRELQVVLQNQTVVQGLLQAVTDQEVLVLDGRKHAHRLPLNQVQELVLDVVAPY
ncbi:MAG: hypothetical protein LPJ89_03555 [Hymenobacteraceae bacterium]|nr:hypothetical protein [Hymenobacteraceae bacterium]MDX5395513.1 hypothetical protein [Hymenobacteraceae bacterium]MDX5442839.1 hypothetical protein [Hymenobacteraceae bacterium]MDX5511567.1 hypothetical protein [Hymenobacteraceae bacterium]